MFLKHDFWNRKMMKISSKMNLQNGIKLKQNSFELVYKGSISDWRNGGGKQIREVTKQL